MKTNPFVQAKWVAAPFFGSREEMSPPPWLRMSFELDAAPQSAHLAITALGLYDCEINGRGIGGRIFAPGWTDYRKRVQYQEYEVTSHLRQGGNAIGVILGDGWYAGHVGWFKRQVYGDRPQLLLELKITLADGSERVIASGPDWKVSEGPILESDLLMGESYDARREFTGWSEEDFDDSEWIAAVLSHAPGIEISPTLDSGVRRQERLIPISDKKLEGENQTSRLFDFGQNFSGRIRLKVKASAGTTLTIRHAEILNPDGSPYYENLRTARATDRYTCRGGEEEIWEPRFTFHGFRYAEVVGLQEGDALEIEGVVLHSDTPRTGVFACSNPLLNQLHQNIVWGQKSNFLEVPTDCPQRDERLGWTGDAQVFIRTACFNMNVREFFHKWMRDVSDAQSPEGAIPPVAPQPCAFIKDGDDGGPAWSDAAIICPWTIYLCYGDSQILADHYEMMKRYVDYLVTERSRNFIRNHPDLPGFTGFGDWLSLEGTDSNFGATPHDLIGTAFLAFDFDLMKRIATVLGKASDAAHFGEQHAKVVAAFRRRFVTEEGLIAASTQTAYVLALHFDLLPVEMRPAAAAELVRKVRQKHFHLGTGFVGTPYLLDVLEAGGHLDVAYKLLEQETFPSWLFPVKNGATTIWERWDGWTPEKGFQSTGMNSFNHYAYGAVGAWMVRSVAGLDLDPTAPGYQRIIFRPRPGGSLTWAEATLDTPQGKVGIRWELKEGNLSVDLTIPEGVETVFEAPDRFAPLAEPLGCGRRTFILHPKDS
ncbi:alpha-L-rhamnosidase [Puniceicoccus vermicola]|uniref:alpha-L-rhamnosidase n=1 Tax=Puniceicoccus vermicola TaxID=388746 RepID=A0A7X1AZN4_9BACT|nr:alpha-L-rhamnosidase [Puniceicoccus vermicola]MBC2602936.1 family 78 glycoside hydrolase catalytic domain [Puniceicoccus vermicola]